MDKLYLQKVFSNQRMEKYFNRYRADEDKAINHYRGNILISESFYPLLTIFEVAFRNSLNRELVAFFGTDEWYRSISSTPGLSKLNSRITIALRHIAKRNEEITASKMVAELTLGFWTQLLNAEYERILWKHLRRAFPFMLKEERQRHKVSAPVNRIRDFRNRVFHHEPVCWKFERLEQMHSEIYSVIRWINEDLPVFTAPMDRVLEVISKVRKDLE